jgi:hypothetical protein
MNHDRHPLCGRRIGWAFGVKRPVWAGLMLVTLFGGCSSDELEGRLFLSSIQTADGTTVGLAIDFVPTSGTFSAQKVQIAIDVDGDQLWFGEQAVSSACIGLPAQRLNFLAVDGELDATSRVRVQAFRLDKERPDSNTAGGGSGQAGAETSGVGGVAPTHAGGAAASGGVAPSAVRSSSACGGTLLDDAVWPTRGARVGARTGTGGTSGSSNGGTAGGGTTNGGVPGGGEAGEAGQGGAAGAPPEAGAGGTPAGGAGGMDASGGAAPRAGQGG